MLPLDCYERPAMELAETDQYAVKAPGAPESRHPWSTAPFKGGKGEDR